MGGTEIVLWPWRWCVPGVHFRGDAGRGRVSRQSKVEGGVRGFLCEETLCISWAVLGTLFGLKMSRSCTDEATETRVR